jgi:hypothetical protein
LDGAHSKNGKPRTAYLSPETTARLATYRGEVAKALGAIPADAARAPSGVSGSRSATRRGGVRLGRRGMLVSCYTIFVARGCARWCGQGSRSRSPCGSAATRR